MRWAVRFGRDGPRVGLQGHVGRQDVMRIIYRIFASGAIMAALLLGMAACAGHNPTSGEDASSGGSVPAGEQQTAVESEPGSGTGMGTASEPITGSGSPEQPAPGDSSTAEPANPDASDSPDTADTFDISAFKDEYGFAPELLISPDEVWSLLSPVDPSTSGAPLVSTIIGTTMTIDSRYQLIDIRASAFYAGGFIPGSVNIPGGRQFELRLREVHLDKRIILVSAYEYQNVAGVIEILMDVGKSENEIFVLDGGVNGWADAGYPLNIDRGRRC